MNENWLNTFPYSSLQILPIYASDHSPLVPNTDRNKAYRLHLFRFQTMWFLYPNVYNVVQQAWSINSPGSISFQYVNKPQNTKRKKKLIEWDKRTFRQMQHQIKKLNASLQKLQSSPCLIDKDLEYQLRSHIDFLLKCQEMKWAQKGKQTWMVQGDRNTSCFHRVVNKRRMKTHILQLKDEHGIWKFDNEDLKLMVVSHFRNLFSDFTYHQVFTINYLCTLPTLNQEQF